MKAKVVKEKPVYRKDKNSALYKKAVNLKDGESLVIENATKKEYDRLRVYFSFKKNAVRSRYLYDMAFSKGIRFKVHVNILSPDNYTVWVYKRTDVSAP